MVTDQKDDGVWFEQRRYGLGVGAPIVWQGWVLLGAYVAICAGLGWLAQNSGRGPRVAAIAMIVAVSAGFIAVAIRHTRGGWRWRWGGDS